MLSSVLLKIKCRRAHFIFYEISVEFSYYQSLSGTRQSLVNTLLYSILCLSCLAGWLGNARLTGYGLESGGGGSFLLANDDGQGGDGRMLEHFTERDVHAEMLVDSGKSPGGG